MIFDSTLLAALVAELRPLHGERLRDIWQSAGSGAGEKKPLSKGLAAKGAAAKADTEDSEDSEAAATGRAVYLAFRSGTLLIDTHSQRARLHLVAHAPEPPPFSTAFGGVLRRALRGARLTAIEQPDFDRALHLRFEARDDVGNLQRYTLVAELMDRRSNLILLDEENVIVDALKRLPPFLNRVRTILPHRPYQPPPSEKQNPLDVSDWDALGREAGDSNRTPQSFVSWLRARFVGISPLVADALQHGAREALAQSAMFHAEHGVRANAQDLPSANSLSQAHETGLHETEPSDGYNAEIWATSCAEFFGHARRAATGDFRPVLCDEQPYPFALAGRACPAEGQSLSALIEQAAAREEAARALHEERAALLTHLAAREKRNAAQREDVAKALRHAADAETFSRFGQLLLTHIAAVEEAARQGATFVELTDDLNWTGTDEGADAADAADDMAGAEVSVASVARIAIEPKWSAADNATRYFNRARRARKLGADAPGRQAGLDEEAAQLRAWRVAAQAAVSSEELRAMARECGLRSESKQEGGAGKASSHKTLSRTKQREAAARPENKLRRREVEGWQLWMGRSALENQTLLSKVAAPSDIWMHVRGEASAHVLIKNQKGKNPPPRVLEEAGRWLATAGRSHKAVDERVEIIYTPAKWVRAVKGAPGRVTLQRFETLLLRLA